MTLTEIKTWRCPKQPCDFTIPYETTVPGRAVGEHYRDAHQGGPGGAEKRVQRTKKSAGGGRA